jgi:hypothetical protein
MTVGDVETAERSTRPEYFGPNVCRQRATARCAYPSGFSLLSNCRMCPGMSGDNDANAVWCMLSAEAQSVSGPRACWCLTRRSPFSVAVQRRCGEGSMRTTAAILFLVSSCCCLTCTFTQHGFYG